MAKKMGLTDKFIDKVHMYDMILANLAAGNSIIEPTANLDNTKIEIGFSNIASSSQISKYFIIRDFPDYMQSNFMDAIRARCILPGVKINFFMYGQPHVIRWDSAEMRNKMEIFRNYTAEQSNTSVFDYRNKRNANIAKERIVWSTKYLNEAELDHKRTLFQISFVVEISSKRDEQSVLNLGKSIKIFKGLCSNSDIKIKELRANMLDWLSYLGIFSLKKQKEVASKVAKKILTDDIIANMNGYKQGRVGYRGVPLGIDVLSKVPILKWIKADPDAAENWLISAETGGGKSYFIKTLLTYLLAEGFVITVMDYEGDEYYNLANYVKAANPEDVKIISMGKGSTVYFDSMEIADLTGDSELDKELKEKAVSFTLSVFRVIIRGLDGSFSTWEERIISTAIKRVYEKAGVTDEQDTWRRSKGLRLSMVYNEIKKMVETKEFVDDSIDNIKHKVAVEIQEGASTYFEEGEAKSGTFKNPMSVNELYKAKFIVFSFGTNGANTSEIDPVLLALKQLSVANVSTQISNYCKYVKRCFNVKVWEEYQRWGEIKGSAEIITNAMTGGRKRGDVNLMITNDLSAILDGNNPVATRIRQNLTSMAIGKIKDKSVRHDFCEKYNIRELEPSLDLIAKAHADDDSSDEARKNYAGNSNIYRFAFCLVLDNGKKAITRVMLPAPLRKSSLFKAGVDLKK